LLALDVKLAAGRADEAHLVITPHKVVYALLGYCLLQRAKESSLNDIDLNRGEGSG
jgi:hypothetical protein